MPRFWITLATILLLSGLFRIYAWLIVPQTAAESAAPLAPIAESEEFRSPQIAQKARQYFPDAPWTADAKVVWQRGDSAMMFMNQVERERSEIARDRDGKPRNLLRVSPLAMVWVDRDRPLQPPYRLQAREGLIEFEHPFSKAQEGSPLDMSASPGRIIWAALEGEVEIDGPDGLAINGRDFRFSEESGELYSDEAIAFHYGPQADHAIEVQGRGVGLTVNFQRTGESEFGKDMPHIGGPSRIMLRKNVELNARFEHAGQLSDARLTTLDAVEYDRTKRLVTFNERVAATRRSVEGPAAHVDSLNCEWLQLEFTEETASAEAPPRSGLFSNLAFRRLRALWTTGHPGSRRDRVVLKSGERQLTAVMQDLIYDATLRKAALVDAEQVEIQTPAATLYCPQVRLQHGELDGAESLQRLECLQAGRIVLAGSGETLPAAEISWSGSLDIAPEEASGLHRASIQGDAQVNVPERIALLADMIDVWAELADLQSLEGVSGGDQETGPLHRPLPVRRMQATGRVRMASPQVDLRQARLVEILIRPGTILPDPDRISRQKSGESSQPDTPWLVDADRLRIELAHDAQQGELDLRLLKATGGIHLEQQPPADAAEGAAPQDLAAMDCWTLTATSRGGFEQVVELRGEVGPQGEEKRRASLSLGEARIEGMTILLDRAANRVSIAGRGGFRFPLTLNDLEDSTTAPTRVMLETAWQDRMEFDGAEARFFGKVTSNVPRGSSNRYQLQCEELSAQLQTPLSFSQPRNDIQRPDIDVVAARHQVRLKAYDFADNVMSGIHDVELADFTLSRVTGKFRGQGLGRISSWSKGTAVRLSPSRDAAQANQPARTLPPGWHFAYVEFAGHLVGNMYQQEVTLEDRVKVISAPVGEPGERFDWDTIDEAPRPDLRDRQARGAASDAFCLTCGKLHIVQRKFVDKQYVELTATDGPDLQAQMFRAVADQLIYDQRNQMFVLRGLGADAQLWLQEQPGQPPAKTEAQLIQYIPLTNNVTINGFKGFAGSR